MRSSFLPLALALLCMGLGASCALPAASPSPGFPWLDLSGRPLAFGEVLPRKAQAGGRLGPSFPARTYALKEGLASPAAQGLELFLKPGPLAGAAALRLEASLSSKADGSSPFYMAQFTLGAEAQRVVLPLAQGKTLKTLTLRLLDAGAPGGDKASPSRSVEDGAYLAEVQKLVQVLPWAGFSHEGGILRLSPGVSVFRQNGEDHVRLDPSLDTAGLLPRPSPQANPQGLQPGIVLSYGPGGGGKSCRIRYGQDEGFLVRLRPAGLTTVLPVSMVPAGSPSLEVVLPKGVAALGFALGYLAPDLAELADFGRILRSLPADPAKDFDLYRWDLLPSVILLDFKDYGVQDRYLKRLAFFVEKIGFKGRLAPNEELAKLHGWNAHDYRAEDLAAFFEAARVKAFKLNPEEESLASLLLERGVIKREAGAYGPGTGALISITRESIGYLRTLFLTHESTHGIFFADAAYRDYVRAAWKAMDKEEKWYWLLFLGWKGYDTANPYLMANEYQAYLLQQTLPQVEDYFTKNQPSQILEKHKELQPELEAYFAKYKDSFLARATALDSWISAKYGFQAGRGASY